MNISHLKNSSHLKLVPVIASFNTEGVIKPLYVRIDGEDIKIWRVFPAENNTSILTFRCEVMDGDLVREIKISYHMREMVWSMPA